MVKVNVHEAKTHLSKLLERAHAGEEIVIAKNGEPYARHVPLAAHQPRTPGLLKGEDEETLIDTLPEDELRAWES